jgi:hypothetical protein
VALDAAISIGAETAYGVSATTTTGYEGQADSWKTAREFIESNGFRAGRQTIAANRRRIVDMGGEGEIELDLLDSGAGALLRACWDALTVTPAVGEGASTLVYTTAPKPTGPSFTSQMVRPKVDGGTVAYRHVGCVVTEWELAQEVEEPLKLTASFDFQTVSHSAAPVDELPIAYPDDAVAYDWTRGTVYLSRNGVETAVAVLKWSVKAARGLKTDRRAVRSNALKRLPVRAEVPVYEGELEVEFDSSTLPLYEAFIAGEVLGLRVAYTGVTESGTGTGASLELVAPAVQFTGESPESSLDDVSMMTLPFRVLDPGSGDDTLRLTYVEPSGDDPTTPAAE